MLKYENKGHVIEIKLPEECGYKGYFVECRYQFDKSKEKYLISMWLRKDGIDDTFKIDSQEIDSQYISGDKTNIRRNICKIVEQASLSGFFDYYIKRYEYELKCFDIGYEIAEKERLGDK